MEKATVISTPDGITAYQLLAQKGALKLECLGMKHSSGRSVAKVIRGYGITGKTKQDLLTNFEAYLREIGVLV